MKLLHRWYVPRRWLDDALQSAENMQLAARLDADAAHKAEQRARRAEAALAAVPLNVRSRLASLEQANATLTAKLDEATAELARRPQAVR